MKDRIEFLDIAKAICIVLVVLGHLNPVPEPQAGHQGNDARNLQIQAEKTYIKLLWTDLKES